MLWVLVVAGTGFANVVAATPEAIWIEAEAYCAQAGSLGPDRPPPASRGECLGSHWGGRKGDFAEYRFWLDRALDDAALHLRYARSPKTGSRFKLFCDGKLVAEQWALKSTAGWGHLRDDEWQYQSVPLGPLTSGWHELKLVALADRNNTNLDGFFLAGPTFDPPNRRDAIEAYPRPRVRRAVNSPGPQWVDEKLALEDFTARLDDWYYPSEEAAQRAAIRMPTLVDVVGDEALLAPAGQKQAVRVSVGGELDGWRIAETLAQPETMVVLEREFDRWGLIVYLGRDGPVAEVRKAVGRLEKINRPHVRFPANYFDRLLAAKEDLLAGKVLASGRDPSYADVAGYLAPLEAYTFLGARLDENKYVVQPDGSIGLLPKRWGPNKPLETVLFDPRTVLPGFSAADPCTVKRGLLGGYLPAVNYGFWDAERRVGWELCAFAVSDTLEPCHVFIRVRPTDGPSEFYKLEPLQRLEEGKPFFAALRKLAGSWEEFFLSNGVHLDLGDRRVEDATRAAIARAMTGWVGLRSKSGLAARPKYGMGAYWEDQHDGFPPTTLSMVACLLDWGCDAAARADLGYYLNEFVRPDGTLTYYGPAVAEYGELLDLAAACVRRTKDTRWLEQHQPALDAIAAHLLRLREESLRTQSPRAPGYGLIYGGAEADTRKETNYYFSGSAWCWRGLLELGNLYLDVGRAQQDDDRTRRGRALLNQCETLRKDVLRAARRSVIATGKGPFLPPIAGLEDPFESMTQDRLASYTNYRYWPETLSARCLPAQQERMILDYRAAHGGELLAMTRFTDHLDDWPFWHQARGLVGHDRVLQYLLGYYAHMAHHQTPGTFTAYEQVPIRGYAFRREYADYCVPAQLTIPIMTRWMLVFDERDADVLWLLRAAPRRWLEGKLSFSGPLTRWGRVGVQLEPGDELRRITARITLDGRQKPAVMLRLRHPRKMRIATCEVTGGKCEGIEADQELVRLRPEEKTITVAVAFQP